MSTQIHVTSTSFQLQILHASDFEAGIPALDDAPRFSAVLNRLKTDPNLPSNVTANTLILSSGDNYIPGAFLNASSDASLNNIGGLGTGTSVIGRGDIGILNALGIQASALGNHEFDLGVRQVRDIIRTSGGNPGTNFPYLSTNLNFQPEITAGNLSASDLATNQTTAEASTIKGKLAKSTVITLPGNDGVAGTADDQKIGIVGATTPTLPSISSSGSIIVTPSNPTNYAALAAEIQSTVDIIKAQGINKIILLSHMQQLNIERDELAPRLRDVDIIIAGGSHTLLSDANDILRTGDTSRGSYPVVKTAADGKPILVVNTDSNYKYVGRLVAEFDNDGVIDVTKLDNRISGAYATDEAGVDRVYGSDVNPREKADPRVVAITDGIRNVIAGKDNVITGRSSVFLNGTREDVRTRETNFGNLTADANLWQARQIDPTVLISLKNGGGIRDNIGVIEAAPGAVDANDVRRLPTQPNPLAPNKQTGDISQLDNENALRFNNALTLVTVTAQQLKLIMEHGVAGTRPGSTPGQFPQVAGLNFSFDPSKTAIAFNNTTGEVATQGERVRSLTVLNADGSPLDLVVQDGKLIGDPNRTFRMVTLNFLAGNTNANVLGGDSYPFPKFIRDNPTLANRVDLLGETGDLTNGDLNRNGRIDTPVSIAPGSFTFANPGTEQDAFAEYMKAEFGTRPFSIPDLGYRPDNPRIINLTGSNTTRNADNSLTLSGNTNLRFTITGIASTRVNELGVFAVDDEQNRIDGIAPGAAGYTQAALSRGRVIFSALANNPQGYNPTQISRILSGLNNGSRLSFYLVQNGTTDGVLAGQNSNVLFGSTAVQGSTLGTNSYQLSFRDDQANSVFNNLVVKVENTSQTVPLGTGLQGQQQRELIDLRGIRGSVKADFTVNREAAFNNLVGFYKVADANGGIDINGDGKADITPGQAGYAQAAMNARVTDVNLSVANQGTANINDKLLAGGSIYAPFLLTDGRTIEQVIAGQTDRAYFVFGAANPDKVDHVRLLGDNTFGFEDLFGGGDFDFNDVIVKANLSIV
ncbi:MAG: 5'-nucleotidase C-terminal domain-containing protein [Calothrix sp. C42_A2020_038]|nr:5'-nucleotidase C-terminal domain-containing protein [Calothrix sp. C42_A2020_038]